MTDHLHVTVWEEKVTIPTYGIGKPNKNPMFFEKRVYQGSSGVVYPHPVIEKILDEKSDKEYTGLFLENKYLKIMILPELGGRIQMAFDKIKQRHFIYYNQVIKPALVGLAGPWISGGIEFNWPQHHRPSTFDPIDYTIEEHPDGSKTIWVNEIEQMFHTKGMAGFTLYPDKAYIEIKARLVNRSELPQTFLWWANPAVKVNDDYQSVFPPDVNAVFDHGKRDVSAFPMATGTYYKVDYSPGTDISMYKNIPVPTSYMAINSQYDFVGGYEHDTQAGLLHVASHHVSPGKKQWTWGNGDFGVAWDRNLTDEDGPYIELMTGMFTDNQPDFTWIMPNEEKSFTQYFMPYRELGVVKNANENILMTLDKDGDIVHLKIYVTSAQDVQITLSCAGITCFAEAAAINPEEVYRREIQAPPGCNEQQLLLVIHALTGQELLRYEPAKDQPKAMPEAARPAAAPEEISSNEQLFLTGQHLEQYRHATYSPVPYYEMALERDPGDIRSNNALGLWYLRRGQFALSEPYFHKAIETSTQRNPNPYDGEPYYNLGLCLTFLNRYEEAYTAFYKSAWNKAWKDTGFFSLAQIDIRNGAFQKAVEHLRLSLENNVNNGKAYVLQSAAYRNLGQFEQSRAITDLALAKDSFNLGALFEKCCISDRLGPIADQQYYLRELLRLSRGDAQNFIEYATDYAKAGLYPEAAALLEHADHNEGTSPLVYYYLGYFNQQMGHTAQALVWFRKAANAGSYLCFPNRLSEIPVLKMASEINPGDAKAPYYLGNLYYDKRQYPEAISCWERSAALDDTFPTVFRNLGIAWFNKKNDPQRALSFFEKAFALDAEDDRLFMELHQLYKRLGRSPQERLPFLEKHMPLVAERDDVYLELITVYNFLERYDEALHMINSRQFHPWEGGEGKVSGQYVHALVQLARAAIRKTQYEEAVALLTKAQTYPHNLGEGKLFGTQENDIFYQLGCAWKGLGDDDRSKHFFQLATQGLDEPAAPMFYNDQQPDKIFYQGLAWTALGNRPTADLIFNKLISYGIAHLNDHILVDYFAVSLPDLLIFEADLDIRNKVHCYFMQGLGYFGLEQAAEAATAFSKVLELDPEHQGAKIHLNMLQDQADYTA